MILDNNVPNRFPAPDLLQDMWCYFRGHWSAIAMMEVTQYHFEAETK